MNDCNDSLSNLSFYRFSISLVFGIVTIGAGIFGIIGGSFMGQKARVLFPSAGNVLHQKYAALLLIYIS